MTKLTIAALAALLSTGCLSLPRATIKHLPPAGLEVSPAGPLPASLGLHVDQNARAAWWSSNALSDIVPIGADAADLLRSALERRFGPLVDVPAWPPLEGQPPASDLVLIPTVADFSTFTGLERAVPTHAVSLRLALFDRAGHLLSTWTVRGAEPLPATPPPSASSGTDPGVVEVQARGPDGHDQAARNLAAAVRQAVADFRADARLDEVLARRAAGDPGPLDGVAVTASLDDQPLDYPGTHPTWLANGVVLVRVRIANQGAAPVRLQGLYVQLRLADGRVIHRLGPAMAMGRLARSASASRGHKAGSFGIFGAIAATADGFKEQSVRDAVRAHLETMTLEPGEVAPGGAIEGVLAFLPQAGGPPFGQASVEVWGVDHELRHLRAAVPLALPAPAPPPRPAQEAPAAPSW